MPVSTGIVCFWIRTRTSVKSVSFRPRALGRAQAARHRIYASGGVLHLAFLRTNTIHDGERCEVGFSGQDGERQNAETTVRLANWKTPDAPRVAGVVLERALQEFGPGGTTGALERFLSLSSAWRVPCVAAARIGAVTIACLPLGEVAGCSQFRGFAKEGANLHQRAFSAVPLVDHLALAWAGAPSTALFFERQDDLLEVAIPEPTERALGEFDDLFSNLDAAARCRLVDAFVSLSPQTDLVHLTQFLVGRLPRSVSLIARHRNAIDLLAAIRIDEEILAITQTSEEPSCPPELTVGALSTPSASLRADIIESVDQENGPSFGVYRWPVVPGCPAIYRVSCEGDAQASEWIVVSELDDDRARATISAKFPFHRASDELVQKLYLPLAAADASKRSAPIGLQSVFTASPNDRSPGPRVLMVGDDHLEDVEQSLLALSLTLSAYDFSVRIIPTYYPSDKTRDLLRLYCQRYGFSGEIVLRQRGQPLGSVLRGIEHRTERPAHILLKTGSVPSRPDWFPRAHKSLVRSQADIFVGLDSESGPAIDLEDVENNLKIRAILSLAPMDFRKTPPAMRSFYGIAGDIVQSVEKNNDLLHSDLQFFGRISDINEADLRLDWSLLRADRQTLHTPVSLTVVS